nr:c-type cytochrome biogenesis protein CcsB [Micromonospora sp. DSM 115978]
MAALSDQLLVVAILAYLVAMVCHAVDAAFSSRGIASRVEARPTRRLVGATVGGPDGSASPGGALHGGGPDGGGADRGSADGPGAEPAPAGTAAQVPPARRGDPARTGAIAGWSALVGTVFGAVVHLAVLFTRGVAAERMPWGNMYEFVLSVTFVGIVGWLLLRLRNPEYRRLGLFVTLAMVVLLGVAGEVLYTPIVPLVPALDSYWFIIHVSTVIAASGILLLGAVPAVLFLLRSGYERGRRGFPYLLGQWAPAADSLERLTFGLHAFAFPLFTFGVIAGAIWAEAAWGRPWGWDPKETWAFISWVVYAGYLHARATPAVKRTVVAWIAIVGFGTMMMNLFGVNIFFEGLHSYGGLD